MIQDNEYPNNVEFLIKKQGFNVKYIDAEKIAKNIGNPKVENSVILGYLSIFYHLKKQHGMR